MLLLEERQWHYADDAEVAGDVQHEAKDVFDDEDGERLSLVEPLCLVAPGLKGAHEDIDVIVAQAEQGLVRIDPRARGELHLIEDCFSVLLQVIILRINEKGP